MDDDVSKWFNVQQKSILSEIAIARRTKNEAYKFLTHSVAVSFVHHMSGILAVILYD